MSKEYEQMQVDIYSSQFNIPTHTHIRMCMNAHITPKYQFRADIKKDISLLSGNT